jgi:dTDP-4-amino-4,6-dideoxygalactose transaminase
MIGATPSLFDRSTARPGAGIDAFLERYAPDVPYVRYGSGKAALRDALDGVATPGGNVVAPAYLPPAVVEPFHELGLESRFYALEETLAPDVDDLERRIDADTVAVVSVEYFGFPQPGFDRIAALADEYGCYHVDDNAHAPLSVADGTLLGTRGDLGVTTLRKLLPVPDGALLYLPDDEVRAAFTPSPLTGTADRIGTTDCRFLATSMAESTVGGLYRALEARLAGEGARAPPEALYDAAKVPMSRLSAAVADAADAESIRARRRENYRAWKRALAGRDDVTPLYGELPAGISPYQFPVRATDPASLLATLEDCGVAGAHTWPRLRAAVRGNDDYETAGRLSRELVALPVHQGIEPSTIAAIGDRLRR